MSSISLKTRVFIWGRAAQRCSFIGCFKVLELDDHHVTEPSLIGEVAHIVADKENGPRGRSNLSTQARNEYSNLLLLCADHHKLIDDHPNEYSVEKLTQMKKDHEEIVRARLDFDVDLQRDKETYAAYVDHWSTLSSVADWAHWSYSILSPIPNATSTRWAQLKALNVYLFNRVWPKRYASLEKALINFNQVLSDFIQELKKQFQEKDGHFTTKQFYKTEGWLPHELYDQRLKEFYFYVDLVQDLVLELTRAANRVCDEVRTNLEPSYRIEEGVILASGGDGFTYIQFRVEYQNALEKYSGIDVFLTERFERDRFIGEAPADKERK